MATGRITTLRVSQDTWRRLQGMKMEPGETMDDVVRRLLDERERREEQRRQSRQAS